jgi:hypothetical protein
MPNFGITITSTASTKEEDKKLGRKSTTHLEGRAIDVRTDVAGHNFVNWMMNTPEGNEYAKRYIAKVYRHDSGHGDHYHIEFKV